jgi:hypothetical protein
MTNGTSGPHRDGDEDSAPTDASSEASTGTAGWQKAMWIFGVLVLIAVGVLLVTGDHGPARHTPESAPLQDADSDSPDGHDRSPFDH